MSGSGKNYSKLCNIFLTDFRKHRSMKLAWYILDDILKLLSERRSMRVQMH